MNILLLGSGGREHALAWKIAASPLVDRLYCAPGNAGIAREAEIVALDIADHPAVIAFCRANAIDLVVVGPEAPLVAGIVDDLTGAGIKAFGPSAAAARLEGSKGFTKDLCRDHGIPTAAYARFTTAAPVSSRPALTSMYGLGHGWVRLTPLPVITVPEHIATRTPELSAMCRGQPFEPNGTVTRIPPSVSRSRCAAAARNSTACLRSRTHC